MTNECAKHFIASIEREIGIKFSPDKLREIWPQMKKESDEAMAAAFDYIIVSGRNMKTEETLLTAIKIAGQKLGRANARKMEEEEERQRPKRGELTFLTREAHDEHGKRCQEIYKLACPFDEAGMPIQPNEERLKMLVELCEVMEKAYPVEIEGWRDLKAHFVAKGLKLRELTATISH